MFFPKSTAPNKTPKFFLTFAMRNFNNMLACPLDNKQMMIGRVVVLPEYRHQGIGTMVVSECEQWAEEMFYTKTVVESRDNKVDFYTKMGYEICGEAVEGDTFRVIRMEKEL